MKTIRLILRFIFLACGYVPKLIFRDAIRAKGSVRIYYRTVEGDRFLAYAKDNLVVNSGRTLLAELLGGGAGTAVTDIAFGTDNTAADGTDVALGAEVLEKPVTVTYPAYNSVKFAATMDAAEGNGATFAELGLKNAANTLFSRLVIGDIAKSSAYEIDVEWTIAFT